MDESEIAEALEPQVHVYEAAHASLEDTSPEGYARSLAPVVAYLIRRAKDEAWDEGWDACANYLQDAECDPKFWDLFHDNPYRD